MFLTDMSVLVPSASVSRPPADTQRKPDEPLVDGKCSVIFYSSAVQYIDVNALLSHAM